MRTSSYTIYVNIPDTDKVVIVNGLSGATDVVHNNVASYLRAMRKTGDEQWVAHPTEVVTHEATCSAVQPTQETFQRLLRRGYVTESSAEQEQEHFVQVVNTVHARSMQRQSFLLIPSYNCNLRCSYCFQNDLRVKEENHHRLSAITPEKADSIFQVIRGLQPTDPAIPRTTSLMFYGGEPFLAENVQNVEYLIAKAHAEGFTALSAITNATELQHYLHVMGPHGVSSLQITLDGPRDAHNSSRVHKDGAAVNTFDQIIENIGLLLPKKVRIGLRVNVTRNNVGQLEQLAQTFRERGWDTDPNFHAYATPVHFPTKTPPPEGFTPYQLDLFMAAKSLTTESAMKFFDRPATGVKGQFLDMFINKTAPQPRSAFCGSNTGMYLFDAMGDVYTCWEWVGFPALRVGHIDFATGELQVQQKQLERWHQRTVANIPTCRKCQYALYCGGGCTVHAVSNNGKFMSSHCNSFPAVFKEGVKAAYSEYKDIQKRAAAGEEIQVAHVDSSAPCR
jgi:uncharacterized protein